MMNFQSLSTRSKIHTVSKCLLLALIVFFCLLPSQANASPASIGIYPPLIKIKTSPGSHIQKEIIISNYALHPITLVIEPHIFIGSNNHTGEITFVPQTKEIKNFFSESVKLLDGTIPVNQLLLSPNQKKSLILDITIPKNLEEKEYYFSMLFISKNKEVTKSNASLIQYGIATNILLSVLRQEPQDHGYIKTFGISSSIKNTPPSLTLEVANQGNHFTNAQGTIYIENILLSSKDIIKLRPENILADSSRYMTTSNSSSNSHIDWNPIFLFGIYKIDAEIHVGNNRNTLQRTIYFYSYPIISLALLIIITIFSGIVYFKISKFHS